MSQKFQKVLLPFTFRLAGVSSITGDSESGKGSMLLAPGLVLSDSRPCVESPRVKAPLSAGIFSPDLCIRLLYVIVRLMLYVK